MMNKSERENHEMIESAISFLNDYQYSREENKDIYLEYAVDLITFVINKHENDKEEPILKAADEIHHEMEVETAEEIKKVLMSSPMDYMFPFWDQDVQGVYVPNDEQPTIQPTYVADIKSYGGIVYDGDNNIQYFIDNGKWHKWTYKGDGK